MSSDVLPPENIYGHVKRLHWIVGQVDEGASLIELGCGTGYMISRPLAKLGFDVHGVDHDEESVAYGKEVFRQEGLDPDVLKAIDIADLEVTADAIIASEVLEHIPDEDMESIFTSIRKKLKPNGKLLVTVPNGYGWFELESFLWFKAGLGKLLAKLKIVWAIVTLKRLLFRCETDYPHPSTLADSPHVRYFTFRSIQTLLRDRGFEITSITGSVLFSGPFSNLKFTGIKPIMKLNGKLGGWLPRIAAGYFVSCRPSGPYTFRVDSVKQTEVESLRQ